jgi:hypothetical protein
MQYACISDTIVILLQSICNKLNIKNIKMGVEINQGIVRQAGDFERGYGHVQAETINALMTDPVSRADIRPNTLDEAKIIANAEMHGISVGNFAFMANQRRFNPIVQIAYVPDGATASEHVANKARNIAGADYSPTAFATLIPEPKRNRVHIVALGNFVGNLGIFDTGRFNPLLVERDTKGRLLSEVRGASAFMAAMMQKGPLEKHENTGTLSDYGGHLTALGLQAVLDKLPIGLDTHSLHNSDIDQQLAAGKILTASGGNTMPIYPQVFTVQLSDQNWRVIVHPSQLTNYGLSIPVITQEEISDAHNSLGLLTMSTLTTKHDAGFVIDEIGKGIDW